MVWNPHFGRADLFDMGGELIETRSYGGYGGQGLSFDDLGRLLLVTSSPTEVASLQLVRLADGKVLWMSRPVVPALMDPEVYAAFPVIDAIDGNRIVVGHTDSYDLAILDAGTGEEVGRIGRDVPIRAVTDDHKKRFLDRLASFDAQRGRVRNREDTRFARTSPVAVRVLAGPPGRMLWVRRHMGVGDELAPPVERMENSVFRL